MDDRSLKRSSCGTQIVDLPSCLIMDILLRLPATSLPSCRIVCKSWYLFFSDPQFLKLHLARSPTYLIRQKERHKVTDSELTCVNSSNGLLFLENRKSGSDEIYVCNPILGEYISIPTGYTGTKKMGCVKSVLGFSSRSNQFKVLRISSLKLNRDYRAELYTIGDGTLHWKSIGIAPFCSNFSWHASFNAFLNGSIHWAHAKCHRIVYFNFDTEQFGSLPLSPALREFTWVRIIVLDGGLSFLGGPPHDKLPGIEAWIMKEYGVEESWTRMFTELDTRELLLQFHHKSPRGQLVLGAVSYNPSVISLQDVARGEHFTVFSRTRTMMGCSQRLSDYLRSRRLDL